MQPCGVRGVDLIPAHWKSPPLCALAAPKKVVNRQDRQLLSVYLNQGVVRFSDVQEKRTNATSADLSKYQGVEPGDFVLNNQQAWRGSVGVSRYEGIVSPAYLVLALGPEIVPAFANLLFRGRSMVGQYLMCSKGVGSIQRNLYWPHLKRISTILPPPDEQAAIVKFLDHFNRKIGRYIQAKQKLIGLLEEQKRVTIQQAVVRVSAVKQDMVPVCSLMRPVKRLGFPDKRVLSLFRDHGVIPKDSRENKNADVRDLALCQLVEPGDVVMNKMKAWQGSIAVSELEGIASPDYMVLKFNTRDIDPRFYHYLLRSPDMVAEYRRRAYGVRPGQWRLMHKDFRRIYVPRPTRAEQKAIANHIEQKLEEVENALAPIRREFSLMREYKTRLTADVVTGKLDVRTAAAGLPDLAPDDELTEMELNLDDDALGEDEL